VAEPLVGNLLQSVSRSFYLSIRFLPSGLREPVGLAYLLARATDSIADTTEVPADLRTPTLRNLAEAIQGSDRRNQIAELPSSFAPHQTNQAERTLIESVPQCLAMLERVTLADRQDIRELLQKITQAQLLDVQRFGSATSIRALATANELNEYTYLIAGCVGEFWTHMGTRHVRKFSEMPASQMLELGRRYGAGLQLINILRDAGGDLRTGRCYFPNDELQSAGLAPGEILKQPAKFRPIFRKWLDAASHGLDAGLQYSLAIPSWRVRVATALPALIGARTLAMLKAAGEQALEHKVKVPRAEVRRILRSVLLSLASRKTLEKLYRGD
jgi:farnesyl-diphosphate farnesyltransferase